MADILVLITIILVIFYAKKIKKIITSKFLQYFFSFDEKKRATLSFYLITFFPPTITNPLVLEGTRRPIKL